MLPPDTESVTVSTSLAGRRLAVLTVLLGGFTAFGPLSMDLYLPGVPRSSPPISARARPPCS